MVEKKKKITTKEKIELISAKTEFSREKTEGKIVTEEIRQKKRKESRKKEFDKKISKVLSKKLVSKKILKPSQMTMIIKKQEPHSILGEENKFFKSTYEQEKRSMYFD